MSKRYFIAFAFLLLFLATAFAGLFIGQNALRSDSAESRRHSAVWHQKFHDRLKISHLQELKLEVIEERFYLKRKALEGKIKLANIELAKAIKTDKSLSPSVQEATNKIHQAMGELQKATLEHLFEMRPILTDEQNRILEQMVTDALEDQQ